jgi:hypothetical protein
VRSVLERIDEERDLERDSERAERRQRRVTEAVAAMSKELALSADQRTRVEQVMRDHQAQLGKLRDPRAPDRPANREERRRQMQALSAQTDTKLATILDANQLTRFRERRNEMLGTGRQRGPE